MKGIKVKFYQKNRLFQRTNNERFDSNYTSITTIFNGNRYDT